MANIQSSINQAISLASLLASQSPAVAARKEAKVAEHQRQTKISNLEAQQAGYRKIADAFEDQKLGKHADYYRSKANAIDADLMKLDPTEERVDTFIKENAVGENVAVATDPRPGEEDYDAVEKGREEGEARAEAYIKEKHEKEDIAATEIHAKESFKESLKERGYKLPYQRPSIKYSPTDDYANFLKAVGATPEETVANRQNRDMSRRRANIERMKTLYGEED